jgi:FkbM family methyltransferase
VPRTRLKALLRRWQPLYGLALSAGKAFDIRTGRWTEPEIALIGPLLRPGETAIDVGANYGMWSYHLSRAVGKRGHVLAFEPIPATFVALRRILRVLRATRVRPINAGVGERDERVTFTVPIARESGTIVGGLAHMVGEEGLLGGEPVEASVTRLDAVTVTGDVALLKIDVEGAELFALRGAHGLIAEHQPTVICEIGRDITEVRYGVRASEIETFLTDLGYEAFVLTGGRLLPVEVGIGHDGNYVFLSPRRHPRAAHLIARG